MADKIIRLPGYSAASGGLRVGLSMCPHRKHSSDCFFRSSRKHIGQGAVRNNTLSKERRERTGLSVADQLPCAVGDGAELTRTNGKRNAEGNAFTGRGRPYSL